MRSLSLREVKRRKINEFRRSRFKMRAVVALFFGATAALHAPAAAAHYVSAGVPSYASVRAPVPVCSASSQRRCFLFGAAAALTAAAPAFAADKGKTYNDCMSKCVYDATKISKGIAQVVVESRGDAMAECEPTLAGTRARYVRIACA